MAEGDGAGRGRDIAKQLRAIADKSENKTHSGFLKGLAADYEKLDRPFRAALQRPTPADALRQAEGVRKATIVCTHCARAGGVEWQSSAAGRKLRDLSDGFSYVDPGPPRSARVECANCRAVVLEIR